jgi:hypothetical protein
VSSPQTVKIPQHNTPQGTWCRFSGVDSIYGTCLACRPQPALSEREFRALLALDGMDVATGDGLASKMRAAGRETSRAAAHQAGAALARKGLVLKGHLAAGDYVRYEITNAGREWIAQYRNAGGAS